MQQATCLFKDTTMINTQDYILGAKEPKAAQPNADGAPTITQGQLGPMPTVPVQPTQPKISTTPAPPNGGRQASVGSVPITKVDYAKTEQQTPPKQAPDVSLSTVRQMDGTTDFDKAAEKRNTKAVTGYGDILDRMIEANRKPMTAEEKAAQEKRHKRDQLINSIGEGISALSNLYFTTKGAPNAYEPSNSLTQKAQARYDKLKAEREAEDAQTINLMLKRYGLDADLATAKAKQDLENQKFGFNVFNADRNFSQKGEIAQKNLDQKQQQIDNTKTYNEGRLGESVRSNKANEGLKGKQRINNGTSSTGDKGGSGKYYGSLTVAGKTYNYKTKADYDKAVFSFAKQYGVSEQDITYEYSNGNTKIGEKRKQRQVHDVAADVEKKSKPQPKPKPQQPSGVVDQPLNNGERRAQGGSGKKKTGVKWT